MKPKSSFQVSAFLGSVLALTVLSGCDSGGGSGSAASAGSASQQASSGGTSNTSNSGSSGSPSTSPSPSSTGAPTSNLTGESCVSSDPNKLCLAINFVVYQDSSGTPTATQAQAATIVHTMNSLWAQCNIGFQIENYKPVDPTASGLSYGAASQSETTQIRQTYNTIDNMLLAVTTGPWGTAVNAWTAMPGENVYGAVMEQSIVDYGSGIIYAHEFGHYLGLDHVSDTSDLMNAVIYTTSTTLTASQCQTARDTANSYWSHMLRN